MLPDQDAALLVHVTMGDPRVLARLCAGDAIESPSDPREAALLRLAVTIAGGAGTAPIIRATLAALGAGCTPQAIVAVLPAIAPLVGSVPLMAAAPPIASALGYDLDAALFEDDEAIADQRGSGVASSPASSPSRSAAGR